MTDPRSTVENILEYLEAFITEKQLKKKNYKGHVTRIQKSNWGSNSPQFVEKLQWIEANQVCLNLQVHSNIK